MSLYVKIPVNELTNGTIMDIIKDIANGREYPDMPVIEENKFDREQIIDLNNYYKNGAIPEENKRLEEKWKNIEQTGEYKKEQDRVKEVNDLRWREYIDNLIDWLIVNDYTEML